jgi:hypothetical protein
VLRAELIESGRAVEGDLTPADLEDGFLCRQRAARTGICRYGCGSSEPRSYRRAVPSPEKAPIHMQTSAALDRIQPSATLAMTSRVFELKRQGVDVIGLGAGEPDFDTPDFVKEAAIEAIRAGKTKYTNVDGTPELKQAIVAKYARDNGLTYAENQISVNSGGKHTLFNAFCATIDAGDEVIIPAPYWVSYPDVVEFAGGTPVFIAAGAAQNYKIPRAARSRDHRQDEMGDAQLAVQPDGRRLFGCRAEGAGRSARAASARADLCRRYVRAHPL